MAIRRGFGDQTWALALAHDRAGLERAAAGLLQRPSGVEYEGHRARAFALALEGRASDALEELNVGWTEEWPTPESYGLDVARIHYLAGNAAQALTALSLDARSVERSQLEDVATLVLDCIRADRRLWRRGLSLVLGATAGPERLLAPLRVLRAWLSGGRGLGAAAQPISPAP